MPWGPTVDRNHATSAPGRPCQAVPRYSPNSYSRSNSPVLHRPVELAQFTSWTFTRRAKESGLLPSMGSIGDCYDSAMIKSFWGRVQTELLDRRRWRTRLELANALFEYLEMFHNRRRRHTALGMLTPIEYELRHARIAPVA
ncbi:integrase core domain-containing protein [Saccharothrix sp. NEAU-S10]|nr:integrase core domain-containing protein [Saccharothrix luteola]